MSSIRLFILGSLVERGPMHGHGLLLLAEEEHLDEWTDFTPGAVHGAIKRLAADGLVVEDRVEQPGNYPPRQVFRICPSGRALLDTVRRQSLTEIVIKPDPFDLAMARLDPDRLDETTAIIDDRLSRLRERLHERESNLVEIRKYLTVAETATYGHGLARLRSEVGWHEELRASLPEILADEKRRARHDAHDSPREDENHD